MLMLVVVVDVGDICLFDVLKKRWGGDDVLLYGTNNQY